MTASVDTLITRLTDAERRLAEHASQPLPSGLSDPDPGAEERWEAGQIWAHLAEFPAYWLGQAQRVIAPGVHTPDECMPGERYVSELAKRGVEIREIEG